jgi:hypothetical protein
MVLPVVKVEGDEEVAGQHDAGGAAVVGLSNGRKGSEGMEVARIIAAPVGPPLG